MVLSNHTEELIEEMGALALSQAVNVLDMVANSEDGLPASDWVGADNRVLRGEFTTNIEWVATRLLV
jgi:hypothetical protein